LILNSNFKIQFEFEKVFNTKLVEIEILKISYFGSILTKIVRIGNLGGGATVPDESPPGTERHGHRRAAGPLPGRSRERLVATSITRTF
jgi:hypothetical protein